jgi:hypothetical protein
MLKPIPTQCMPTVAYSITVCNWLSNRLEHLMITSSILSLSLSLFFCYLGPSLGIRSNLVFFCDFSALQLLYLFLATNHFGETGCMLEG